ncbi:MAG: class I SAM-dependent methyltransferase [Rubrivivax sp.]|nr:class I SAM-dependent methyltransferase [Rubrivivax sp.]
MTRLADWLSTLPLIGPLGRRLRRTLRRGGAAQEAFPGTAAYWQARYAAGGDSGAGSYGRFAKFKARVLNGLFDELQLRTVIEFGSGDGNQLMLLQVADYTGVDISAEAVARCRERFAGRPGRRFMTLQDFDAADPPPRAECTLSLDVVYHLVEDTTYDAYMRRLFDAATRVVVVYSSNHDEAVQADGAHIRHRMFTRWVDAHAAGWQLLRHVPNEHPFRGDYRTGSFADFFVFVRTGAAG